MFQNYSYACAGDAAVLDKEAAGTGHSDTMNEARVVWQKCTNDSFQVQYISVAWPNFSAHSGYEQLIRYSSEFAQSHDNGHSALPRKFGDWFVLDHASRQRYTRRWLCYEMLMCSRLLCTRNTIYHFLYGDISYRYLGRLSGFHGNKVIVSLHEPYRDVAELQRKAEHLKSADAVIVVGSEQLQAFRAVLDPGKVFHVLHGIDTNFFRPSDKSRDPQAVLTCLFVGSHHRDIETLSEVIKSAQECNLSVKFEVVTDKQNFAALACLPNVTCHCRISEADLISLYQKADLLVEPLIDATANSAILEGMACGLPIVVTDVGSVRDYVNEDCAIFTPPRNPKAMIDAISLLGKCASLRRRLGENGRRRALKLDWSEMAAQVKQVYRHVLSSADSAR